MLAAYLVCAAVHPDPSLVDDNSTVVILEAGEAQALDAPTDEAALLVIPLIVVAVEADQVIHHSRKYLQMLELVETKLVLACGQGELNPTLLPDLATLPDGLVGRFDTIIALRRADDRSIREACTFITALFTSENDGSGAEGH